MSKTKIALFSVLTLLAFVGVGCRRVEPIGTAILNEFKTNADVYALQSREHPEQLGQLTDRFRLLAEQAASNLHYEQAAPREAAIAYRLYAGHLLIRVNGRPKAAKAKDALPWLERAVTLGRHFTDITEFKEAKQYFKNVADEGARAYVPTDWAQHMIRVCMIEATPQQFGEIVDALLGMIDSIDKKQGFGASLNADVDYLEAQGRGEITIKEGLMAFKAKLHERNPGKDVGSDSPISITPLPNGNTRIRYQFLDKTTPRLMEWEVNKAKGIITPRTDGARMIMQLVGLGVGE